MSHTQSQLKVIEATTGAHLVLAAPGSGKTYSVTERIVAMIAKGIRASDILAVTFTKKAATEMYERVSARVGKTDATITTFHSLAFSIFKNYSNDIGFSKCDIVYPDYVADKLVELHPFFEGGHESLDKDAVNAISKLSYKFSDLKKNYMDPEEYLPAEEFEIYDRLEKYMMKTGKITFDDMIYYVCKLFDMRPDILNTVREKYKYIIIDEAQDTNISQFVMVYGLNHTGNIMIVGDPLQAIYRFQSANVENIMDFEKRLQPTVHNLDTCFRCSPEILKCVNHVMSYSLYDSDYKIPIASANKNCSKPIFVMFRDSFEQASAIGDTINSYVRSGKYKFKDFAVLYRNNSNSMEFEQVFLQKGIPYDVKSGNFIDRKEIRLILSCLKLGSNQYRDELISNYVNICKFFNTGIQNKILYAVFSEANSSGTSFEEVVETTAKKINGIGPKRLAALKDFCDVIGRIRSTASGITRDLSPMIACIEPILSQYSASKEECFQRLENLEVFKSIFDRFYKNAPNNAKLNDFINHLMTIFSDDKEEDDDDNKVVLSTMHSFKGLEKPCVFVVNVRDGVMPRIPTADRDEITDELNLFYVALSRAKVELFVSAPYEMITHFWKETSFSLLRLFLNTDCLQGVQQYKEVIGRVSTPFSEALQC